MKIGKLLVFIRMHGRIPPRPFSSPTKTCFGTMVGCISKGNGLRPQVTPFRVRKIRKAGEKARGRAIVRARGRVISKIHPEPTKCPTMPPLGRIISSLSRIPMEGVVPPPLSSCRGARFGASQGAPLAVSSIPPEKGTSSLGGGSTAIFS